MLSTVQLAWGRHVMSVRAIVRDGADPLTGSCLHRGEPISHTQPQLLTVLGVVNDPQ